MSKFIKSYDREEYICSSYIKHIYVVKSAAFHENVWVVRGSEDDDSDDYIQLSPEYETEQEAKMHMENLVRFINE